MAVTIDVSIPLFINILFSNFPLLVYEDPEPPSTWMVNPAALKAKLWESGYGGDGDTVIGAAIAPEFIVYLSMADMHIDYNATLSIVQSLSSSVWQSSFQDKAIH